MPTAKKKRTTTGAATPKKKRTTTKKKTTAKKKTTSAKGDQAKIKELLAELANEESLGRKKAIRARLRTLGHRGGLRGTKTD